MKILMKRKETVGTLVEVFPKYSCTAEAISRQSVITYKINVPPDVATQGREAPDETRGEVALASASRQTA